MSELEGAERLDRRMITMTAVLTGVIAVVGAVVAGSAMISSGTPAGVTMLAVFGGALVVFGLSVGVDYIRWRATTYRLSEERLELRFSFVLNRRRSLARDRIRTVDVTASPLQRLFGIAAVVIGTGQSGESGESEVKLDAVSRERAHELRRELLRHAADAEPHTDDGTLAELDWRWAAYAPLSVLTPALGAAAVGAVANVASWFGDSDDVVGSVVSDLLIAAALFGYVTVVIGVLLAGAIGALLLFVEMWWGYRLDREPGGTLHVRRGLLTSRSISLEERRLRGAEIIEPLGVRLARAGRVDAIATGIREGGTGQGERTDHKTLLPAAPRAVALRVVSDVLREPDVSGALTGLTPHPRAARSRRLRWALAPVTLVFAVLLTVELAAGDQIATRAGSALAGLVAAVPWVFAVIAVPIAVLLAVDAYRNLGHGLSGRYLVARRGVARRSTALVQRTGVIGWTVRQSIFQRRSGLLTLVATTAAGSGAYTIPDVDVTEGVAFADEAVPDLLAEFIERPGESPATTVTRER
ncbi:PH domain-containing protein [Haloechinothrix salitolerans]|uniref:PH domain-containing protein n=1 Tax=Haloechinothrix salitolerans TaxID=926830 RepID=A0ABW2BYU9_9PSEU